MTDGLAELLQRFTDEENFSGVCLVRQEDREVFHRAYGLAHRGFDVPNTVETRFDIASITKLFTAAAILQLIDRQELTFDTQVTPLLGIENTTISDDVPIC